MKYNFVKAFTFAALLFSVVAQAQQQQLAMKLKEKQFPVVQMAEGRREKDLAKGIQYLTDQQREQTRLVIKNGIAYDYTGQVVSDTKNDTLGHKDKINYVMDGNGNLYLFNEYAFPKVRHSSIFAGKPVAGAGEISIKGGRIIYIDSDSGHYSSRNQMGYVAESLQEDGVDLRTVDIEKN